MFKQLGGLDFYLYILSSDTELYLNFTLNCLAGAVFRSWSFETLCCSLRWLWPP